MTKMTEAEVEHMISRRAERERIDHHVSGYDFICPNSMQYIPSKEELTRWEAVRRAMETRCHQTYLVSATRGLMST